LRALFVLSLNQAKRLIAKAIAQKLINTKRRIYIAYGSTNGLILDELGIKKANYYNGYIDDFRLKANSQKPNIVILNGKIDDFLDTLCSDDVIIKGANALSFENGKYCAGVVVASSIGGTYGSIILKASCVGAKVIIPVSHEKLVPKILDGKYSQNDFDMCMGLPIAMFRFNYGDIYTEIEAFKDLYNLDATLYCSGGLNKMAGALSFVLEGSSIDILEFRKELENDM